MNKKLNILVACEESQAVTIELRKLGHNAFSCDIMECSGHHPEWHIMGDVLPLLNGNCSFKTMRNLEKHTISDKWDMIIAFPPCTDLCVSGARHFAKKIADGTQQRSIDFFMKFVDADCDKIAIENPIGIMSSNFRKPDQMIQPYEFGSPVKKTTCLWLKNIPLLVETDNVKDMVEYYTSPVTGKKMSEWNARQLVINGKKYGYNTKEFKTHRSKTFPGIAKAMAEQWTK